MHMKKCDNLRNKCSIQCILTDFQKLISEQDKMCQTFDGTVTLSIQGY